MPENTDYEIHELLKDFFGNDMEPTEEDKYEVKYLTDNSISDPQPISKMTKSIVEGLDHFAARFFDQDSRTTVVIGEKMSGKTFFIEQFAHNIHHYLDRTDVKAMEFIIVDEQDMQVIGDKSIFAEFVEYLTEYLEVEESNLCFVTPSVDVAMFITNVTKHANIILELNKSTFYALLMAAEKTASRVWNNWKVFDAESIIVGIDEIVPQMMNTAVKKHTETLLNRNLGVTKRHMNKLVDTIIEHYPDFKREYKNGEMLFTLPIGVWGILTKYLFGLVNFTSDSHFYNKSGTPKINMFLEKLVEETKDFISVYERNRVVEVEDFPIEIIKLLEKEGIDIIGEKTTAVSENSDTLSEKSPLLFNSMKHITEQLKKEIIGQDDAIDTIVDGLVVPAASLNSPEKPLRSFLFSGPTGVGKTQTALELAKHTFKNEINVVRIDMSEYQSEHEASKLFGAPPGYLGFETGGALTSKVLEHPNSLILLDEIEKAHPKIWDTFLQVLDSGRMTDGKGNVVDFTQCIIIMTSNIGVKEATKESSGFSLETPEQLYELRKRETSKIVMKAIEKEFRPEFINRIDEIVMFNELSRSSIQKIILKEVDKLRSRMGAKGVKLNIISDEVMDSLIEKSDIAKYGAREIQRVLYRNVTNPLAYHMVNNDSTTIDIDMTNEKITVKGS